MIDNTTHKGSSFPIAGAFLVRASQLLVRRFGRLFHPPLSRSGHPLIGMSVSRPWQDIVTLRSDRIAAMRVNRR